MLSETHITDAIEERELRMSGYEYANCTSHSRHTGGVMIYIRKKFQYKVTNIIKLEGIWLLGIMVWINNCKWFLITLYRSPNKPITEFINFFINWCDEFLINENNIIITGDFNVNILSNDPNKRTMCNVILDQGLNQLITQPTRITLHSRSLIDYVLTKVTTFNVKVDIDHDNKISDHETVKIEIKGIKYNANDIKAVRIVNYSKNKFERLMQETHFEDLYFMNDLKLLSEMFEQKLVLCVNQMTYNKLCSEENCSWFSAELNRMKQEKKVAYQDATYRNSSETWLYYKRIRNMYKNEIKKAKNNYIESQIRLKAGNQKTLWRAIKDLVTGSAKRKDREIRLVNFYGDDEMEVPQIAEKFNKYFVESIQEINASIPSVQYQPKTRQVSCTFKFNFCDEVTLCKVLDKCNNKRDFNGLNCNMIYKSIEIIGPILMKIINLSIQNGTFPCWKESLVIPVEKVPNTIKSEEFRPINVLPIYEKIIERFVANQLEKYIEVNNLLIKEQSGFRRQHSCESALNWILFEWKKQTDAGKTVIAVFLDFKRAFETIDRAILLQKLEAFGIKRNELKWFRSYLCERSQKTKINNTVSSSIQVDLGVPQGSILGVLLFVIYINDIKAVIQYSEIALFADDTLLYVSGTDANECIRKINKDLNNIDKQLKMNKLNVNPNKSKCIKINWSNSDPVIMDHQEIECVGKIKYLGVILDHNLKLKDHVDYVSKKIAKKIGFLSRIRRALNINTSILLYNALILPHFDYCSTLLYASNIEDKARLQRLQSKAMRVILKCNLATPIRTMLEVLSWMNVKQRLTYNAMVFIFKIKHNLLPEYLSSNVCQVREVQPYNLRRNEDFRLERWRRSSTQNSLMYKGLQYFNNLPTYIKTETRLEIFKKKVKEFIICNV